MNKPKFFVLPSASNPLVERMLYLALAVVFVGQLFLAGIILYQNQQERRQTELLTQQVEAMAKVSKDQGEIIKSLQTLATAQGKTVEEVNKSLSCILVFFTTPGRTEYYISNLATCEITNRGTGEVQVLPIPQASASTQSPQSSGSQQGGSSPQPSNPPPNNPPPSNPPSNNPPPSQQEPSIVEDIINNTTDFTCGLVGLLCR
jgi:hypothetical protein